MNDQEHQPDMSSRTVPRGTPPLDPHGAARRRFARIGTGAAGVILTLHSQPGMAAAGKVCTTPSGFTSMTSDSNSPQQSCEENRSHGYWKKHPDEWKSRAGVDHEALFGNVFRVAGNYETIAGVTLMEIVDPTEAVKAVDHNNVAMQTVAAWLNARAANYAGLPTVLSEQRVMTIWDDFVTQGYYLPGPGATVWTGAQIAEYFESTFR